MKIEDRITNVKEACQDIKVKASKYLIEKGDPTGLFTEDLESTDLYKELKEDLKPVSKIYRGVNISNISACEDKMDELQEFFKAKYGFDLKRLPTNVDKSLRGEPVVEETEETKVDGKKSNGVAVVGGLLGAGILAGSSYAVVNHLLNGKGNVNGVDNTLLTRVLASNNETVVEETENQIPVIRSNEKSNQGLTVVSAEEAAINEVVSESLVLGEYGTFFDASNEEQVMARAEYLYNNYYMTFMSELNQTEREYITVERIANTIRVMNGHCPVDENGYMELDANTVDTYGQAFIELTANIPSSDAMGTVKFVPAYLFAEDGSDLQRFIKSYDDLYARIAEGRNTRNSDEYRAAGKIIAAKYWTEWFLQGMGGNVFYNAETQDISYGNGNVAYSDELGRLVRYNPDTLELDANTEVYQINNPHNFDATYRYFAYQATTARYGSFIKEAEFNQMATICIPACIDYSSKTLEELSIPEIYTAINDGVWNDIIARSAGMEIPTQPMLVGFWEALDDQLNFEYTHTDKLVLK